MVAFLVVFLLNQNLNLFGRMTVLLSLSNERVLALPRDL